VTAFRVGLAWLVLVVTAVVASAQALADPPSLPQARALYDAGNLEDARRVLKVLIDSGTKDPEVFLLAGVVDRTEGRLTDAIASLQQAQALAPRTVRADVELATTLAWNQNLDRAIALFRQVLVEFPDNIGARNGLAFALAWQGQLTDARQMFTTMTEQDPNNVSAWIGVGFVERASLNREEARAAYQRVLTIDPANAEARTALAALLWDRRGESRVLPGFSTSPGAPEGGEGRLDVSYAVNRRITLLGGYQHYAFGAATVTSGGGVLTGVRTEDSFESGIIVRPSPRMTLAASAYTFFSDDMTRGILWLEGVFVVNRRLSLIGNARPAYSSTEPPLFAWAGGAAIAFTQSHQVTARALVASNTELEPRLTLLANYDATFSTRFKLRLSAAQSSTDERYEFVNVGAGATYLLSPSFGVTADVGRRFQTAERSTILAGVLLRY
jgi:tetratricopeptide (TPR) repeat protein